MARHFVRLKLALLLNGLRRSPVQRASLALGALTSLPAAVAVSVALSFAGRTEEHGESILVVAFALVFVGWLVLPVLAFARSASFRRKKCRATRGCRLPPRAPRPAR